MGITLKKLTSDLKDLQLEGIEGADLLLKGIQLLVEHADSPWAELIKGIFPPAHFVIGLIKAIQLKKSNFNLDTCTAMAIQQAYLDVLQTTLREEKGTLETRFDLDDVEFDKKWRRKLEISVEQLLEYTIDATQLDFPHLHNESLVKDHLEQVATNWLTMRLFKHQKEEIEAVNFARRISYQLYPQLLRIVGEHEELYAPLAKYLEKMDHRELRDLRGIEKYKAYLMKLPLKPVFNETFALKDLYIELEATEITQSSKRKYHAETEVDEEEKIEKGNSGQLMQAVFEQLDDKEHVVFIQAGPGKGKSVFCQMLAARVATERPDWIPIFVRLRDLDFSTGDTILEIIKKYIEPHFDVTSELLRTRRFLFILDGFDELWLSSDADHSLKFFFERLSMFQKECAEENRWSHKIIITGRPMRIQDIESELPSNFLRLRIENMEKPQFEAWLSNWAKLFSQEQADKLRIFLQQGRVFEKSDDSKQDNLRTLASEPLLLYMLGAMHREGAITDDILETSRRIAIYDRAICWVCGNYKYGKPHRDNKVLEKSGVNPDEFRQLLQETALCIWQGERDFAPIERIRKRLSDIAPLQTKKLFAAGFEGIYNLLASFYFQQHEGISGNVEFSHKSFSEYLVAEKMVDTLKYIGERSQNQRSRQEEYRIKDIKNVASLFYSIFGADQLTYELRDLVMDLIGEQITQKEITYIAERLYNFYIDYSNGRWMDEGISRTQWDELRKYDVDIGLLKFEATVGVNLFVLLCLLYQHTNEKFKICGKEEEGSFDPNRIRKLFGSGEFIRPLGFLYQRAYRLLKKVSLHGANLVGIRLWGAYLQEVDLQDVDLVGAELQGAELQNADLRNADLRGTNFHSANLQGADLRGAKCEDRKLRYAVLKTDFRDANLTGAKIYRQELEKYRNLFSDEQIVQLNIVVNE